MPDDWAMIGAHKTAIFGMAQLGGFIGRKSDGYPGVKVLWRGWQRLQDLAAMWELFHPPKKIWVTYSKALERGINISIQTRNIPESQ